MRRAQQSFTVCVYWGESMKTIGERVRQAREHRGLSGVGLAKLVGYKTQSGVSNLENRASGRGGFMLPKIAQVLDVSIDWLLDGPDTADVSQVPAYARKAQGHRGDDGLEWPSRMARSTAHGLIDQISEVGLARLLPVLEDVAKARPENQGEK